eukprot:jgi/Mesvir1/4046/Mv26552-RA.2
MQGKKSSQKRHKSSRWRRCRQIVPAALVTLICLHVFQGYLSVNSSINLVGSAQSSGGASGSAPQDTAATTATSKPTIAAAITEADVSIDPLSALSVMPDDPLAQAVPDAVARMGSGFLDTWKSTQEGARDQAALAGGAARNSRVIGDVQVLYSRVAGAKQEQMAEASKPKPTAASRFQSLFMTRGTANPVAVGKRAPDDVAGQMGPAKHLIRHQVTLPFPEGGYKTDPASLLPLEGPIWMTIGMPTFPRAGNPDYLQRSVLSFLSGLPLDTTDLFYGKIQLVIMNNKPGDHKTFYAVREQMRQLASPDKERAAAHIVFVENPGTIIDPEPNLEEPNDKNNPEALPGSHVRNQTAQVLELTKLLKDKSKLFMFVEDDFIFCTNWLEATQMALKKASVEWMWLLISLFGYPKTPSFETASALFKRYEHRLRFYSSSPAGRTVVAGLPSCHALPLHPLVFPPPNCIVLSHLSVPCRPPAQPRVGRAAHLLWHERADPAQRRPAALHALGMEEHHQAAHRRHLGGIPEAVPVASWQGPVCLPQGASGAHRDSLLLRRTREAQQVAGLL